MSRCLASMAFPGIATATWWVILIAHALVGARPALAADSPPHAPGVASVEVSRAVESGPPPRFAFLDGPAPPLPDLPPEPTREADEYPRRAWETFPSGGASTPFCRGSVYGLGHCGEATSGATLGLGALYRVSPYIAVGLDASFTRFTLRGAGAGPARSEARFIGLLVRGYFFDRGALDPYVETAFGQGASFARHVEEGLETGAVEVRTESLAPTLMAGAGIDFWLAPYVKLGPALTYRFSWISNVRGCWGAACGYVGVDERGAVGSYATVSVRATLALGREM